ncbi:hypothetical protein RB623_14150 [Mesorhizobium sp. LHD-90]|nr:hypothetical protein [Mesorhizobium sp. LHD-90]MDQ6435195.1 hypothetical protein [Mesorhizobium sp. LHD-90]
MRSALLSLAMLVAIVLFGMGVYSVDAGSEQAVVDGYGVVAATH